jgi:hypothetical protein
MLALDQLPKVRIPEFNLADVKTQAERYLVFAAVIMTALVFVCVIARAVSTDHSTTQGMIRIKVHQGDNIWNYASKYGNSNEYILKRVHRIAELNHIDLNRPLTPGQELIIPCDKNVVCAKTP